MKKYRLGVVGLGHRGSSIFESVGKGIPEIELAAACDLRPELWFKETNFFFNGPRDPLSGKYTGVVFHENYDEMLEKADLDIVLVETPAQCHADFCAKALRKNINVFSDIPSVGSLQDADMLWKAQQESKAMLMTGATTRGWGFVLALQELYRKELLGKPYYLEAEYIHDCRMLWEETPWRKPGPENHRYPITYCTHSLGPLLSVMDEDLRTVSSMSTGSHVTGIPEAEDLSTATFRTDSGVIARLTCSFINQVPNSGHSYRIHGTKGFFEHTRPGNGVPSRTFFSSTESSAFRDGAELKVDEAPSAFDLPGSPGSRFGHGGADGYLWHIFVQTLLKNGKCAPIDLKAGLRMTLPGIFAAESAKKGGEIVRLRYPWDADKE